MFRLKNNSSSTSLTTSSSTLSFDKLRTAFTIKGFLLLEVMLAVTILSVGMALVLRSYVSALNAVKISQDFLAAGLLLEEKLWQKEEEKAGSQEPSVAGEEGSFASPWDRFSYLVEFEKEEDAPDLYKTSSSVSWQSKKKTHSILCVSYIRSKEK